jgi:hypothetical protein
LLIISPPNPAPAPTPGRLLRFDDDDISLLEDGYDNDNC